MKFCFRQVSFVTWFMFIVLFSYAHNTLAEAGAAQLLSTSGSTEPAFILTRPGLSSHKDIYVMPLSWAEVYSGTQTELIFQLSAKVKLFGSNAFFAFTQRSFWQAYNKKFSSPFRETNYNPEIFYRFTPGDLGFKNVGFDVGAEHESNGQVAPVSRSWNRLYVAPYWRRTHDLFYLKLWYRVPESKKVLATDTDGDDNPDLQNYTGRSEFHYRAKLLDGSHVHFSFRANPSTKRGAASFSYNLASDSPGMFYRVSLYSGYGESLIDYNRNISRVALGVSFIR